MVCWTAEAASAAVAPAAWSAAPLHEVDLWLQRFRRFWDQRLDALATELARGKHEGRMAQGDADHRAVTGHVPPDEGREQR